MNYKANSSKIKSHHNLDINLYLSYNIPKTKQILASLIIYSDQLTFLYRVRTKLYKPHLLTFVFAVDSRIFYILCRYYWDNIGLRHCVWLKMLFITSTNIVPSKCQISPPPSSELIPLFVLILPSHSKSLRSVAHVQSQFEWNFFVHFFIFFNFMWVRFTYFSFPFCLFFLPSIHIFQF